MKRYWDAFYEVLHQLAEELEVDLQLLISKVINQASLISTLRLVPDSKSCET